MASSDFTHALLVAAGSYPGEPEERWQFGIRFIVNHGLVPPADHGSLSTMSVDDVNETRTESLWNIATRWTVTSGLDVFHPDDFLNDQVAPAMTTFMADAHISTDTHLDSLKLSPINSLGHVADLRTCELTWTSSNPGGSDSQPQMPLQVSSGVSWQTPLIGRHGRGRIYLPAASDSSISGGSGVFTSTHCNDVRDAAIAMLEASSFLASGTGWSIVPIVTGKPYATYGEILEVRVSNVPDTQRRRRRSLTPTFHTGAVSY